jgi:hypothetical protein
MANGEFKELSIADGKALGSVGIIVVAQAGTKDIPLQFPPAIESDGKVAKWDGSDQGAYEPLKTYNGSDSRTFNVKLKYVVVGGKWTASRIAQIGRDLRSYFYNSTYLGYKGYPVVKIYAYGVIPIATSGILTCRLMSVSTSYKGALMTDDSSGNRVIFSLITEHTLSLEAASRIEPGVMAGLLGMMGGAGQKLAKFTSLALTPSIAPEWY